MSKPTACALYVIVLCALPAAAATIDVPGDQPTIAAAIAAAGEGDEIVLGPGPWTENVDLQAADAPLQLTLRGAGMFTTIWDAGDAGPCLRIAGSSGTSWTLRDLSFTNPGAGAAAAVDVGDSGGQWVVESCRFFLCDEDMLRCRSGLTLTGCVFGDATGLQVSGLVQEGGTATVTRCTFDNLFRAAFVVAPAVADFSTCIFSDLNNEGLNFGASVTVDCCCRFNITSTGGGWPTGTNIIAADPEFCGVLGQRNWELQSDSPCADHGTCGTVGARGVGCATVGEEDLGWGELKARFR